MKVEFNTLYWKNTPSEQTNAHKGVMEHFQIPVNYYEENIPHGIWMNRVMSQSQSDIVVFFDADCVPICKHKIHECIQYVNRNKNFLGIAQVSNHIPPRTHIYAAPAFYVMYRECWLGLGSPSFSETSRSDVAEEISYIAESSNNYNYPKVRYRCLYPDTFEREPAEGIWPLSNYGYYGVGTTFNKTVYHLYQGRMGTNIQLFVDRCDDIISGIFDNRDHAFDARVLNYKGKIVK